VLLVLAACGNAGDPGAGLPGSLVPSVVATGSTPPAFLPASPSAAPGVTAPPATQTTTLGSRLTLARGGGATADVNALEMADPARGRVGPPSGTRWVAIRIEISNPEGPAYSETPADAARLIDGDGRVYAGWRNDPVPPGFGGQIVIREGDFDRGFVAFSVPLGAAPKAIRFTLDARTAPDTGEWRL